MKNNTEIFRSTDEIGDYLCWTVIAQMLTSDPVFANQYQMLINNSVNLFNLGGDQAKEIKQEAKMSVQDLAKYLARRAQKFEELMEERDRFGE